MASVNIDPYLENIKKAVYGEEVRGSIHDAIKALHDVVEEDVTTMTSVFDWTTPEGTAADAKAINDKVLLIRGKLEGATGEDHVDFNDITTTGAYRLVSSQEYDHSPLTTVVGWMIVYQYGNSGVDCIQIIYETGTSESRSYQNYFRSYNADRDRWSSWQSPNFELDDTLSMPGYAADAAAVGIRLADLEYVPIAFDSLTYTAYTQDNLLAADGAPVEIGNTVTSINYQWITNKTPLAVSIDGNAITIDEDHPTWNQGSINSLSVTTNRSWRFRASEEAVGTHTPTTAIRDINVSFMPRIFWGVSEDVPDPDSSFIESFRETYSTLSTTQNRTINITAGDGEYIWYIYPVSFGTSIFSVNGFKGGFRHVKTVTFTNIYGATDQYHVYRSDNPNLGPTELVITAG